MQPPKTGNYAVAFTALTDGDDLGCSKPVDVSWEKPSATDQARLRLFCNCSQHAAAEVGRYDTPTTSASGGYTFNVTHTSVINETDRKLEVTIEHGGVTQKNDVRISMYAQCPLVAHDGDARAARKKRKDAAPGNPIEIDPPDSTVIQLKRGEDKLLRGQFDRTFGRRIMVFVHKIQSGRPVLRLAKEIRPLTKRWRIKLPHVLWDGGGILNVRLVFVSKKGILGNGFTFPTKVT